MPPAIRGADDQQPSIFQPLLHPLWKNIAPGPFSFWKLPGNSDMDFHSCAGFA